MSETIDEVATGENIEEVATGENIDEVATGENIDEVATGENNDEVATGENNDEVATGEKEDEPNSTQYFDATQGAGDKSAYADALTDLSANYDNDSGPGTPCMDEPEVESVPTQETSADEGQPEEQEQGNDAADSEEPVMVTDQIDTSGAEGEESLGKDRGDTQTPPPEVQVTHENIAPHGCPKFENAEASASPSTTDDVEPNMGDPEPAITEEGTNDSNEALAEEQTPAAATNLSPEDMETATSSKDDEEANEEFHDNSAAPMEESSPPDEPEAEKENMAALIKDIDAFCDAAKGPEPEQEAMETGEVDEPVEENMDTSTPEPTDVEETNADVSTDKQTEDSMPLEVPAVEEASDESQSEQPAQHDDGQPEQHAQRDDDQSEQPPQCDDEEQSEQPLQLESAAETAGDKSPALIGTEDIETGTAEISASETEAVAEVNGDQTLISGNDVQKESAGVPDTSTPGEADGEIISGSTDAEAQNEEQESESNEPNEISEDNTPVLAGDEKSDATNETQTGDDPVVSNDKEETSEKDNEAGIVDEQILSGETCSVTEKEQSVDTDMVIEKEKSPEADTAEEKEKTPENEMSVDNANVKQEMETSGQTEGENKDAESKGEKPGEKKSKPKQACVVCQKVMKCKYNIVRNGDIKHLCDDKCFKVFRANPTQFLKQKKASTPEGNAPSAPSEKDAANTCDQCKKVVSVVSTTFRTGNKTKQFCGKKCMEDYKTDKICHHCLKDLVGVSTVLTMDIVNIGTRRICSQTCKIILENQIKRNPPKAPENADNDDDDDDDVTIVSAQIPSYTTINRNANAAGRTPRNVKCSVCSKMSSVRHEVSLDGRMHKLCSDSCFAAFRYANKLSLNDCLQCGNKMMSVEGQLGHSFQYQGKAQIYCSAACMGAYKSKHTKMIPCTWCNNKKPCFDMVEKEDPNTKKFQLFCSLNCLSLYRVNLQATSTMSIQCDQCKNLAPARYHLTMSDASVRNFCTWACAMAYQAQFNTPSGQTPQSNKANDAGTGRGRGKRSSSRVASKSAPAADNNMPMISNVMSLAQEATTVSRGKQQPAAPIPGQLQNQATPHMVSNASQVTQQIIVQPPAPKQLKNKALLCKPYTQTKATSCRPHSQPKECQTDNSGEPKQILVPIPVPIYIPVPMAMYNYPMPYPVPLPIPIPVPAFIPTTKKNADKILKHIKEIQERTPADPFEAELLMMAEAVAKEGQESSSDSDEEDNTPMPSSTPRTYAAASSSGATPGQSTNELGEDMLQIALRMASEMTDEPVLDLETSLNPTPINPDAPPPQPTYADSVERSPSPQPTYRGRGRGKRRGRGSFGGRPKRPRVQTPEPQPQPTQAPPTAPPPPPPDQNCVLKYTYGVNAFKHWVLQKNTMLEKQATGRRKPKLFKADLMRYTADELNYALTLFTKEVRKPNGEQYAPDSIFYLCLGIQQFLFENGRIDNIFADTYFEQFTERLNEVLHNYEVRLNAQGLIVCRIEEEHLWEAKMLGAHSPHVLLNTLIYFNTKYFMLKTPEEHLKLSFSHIMKHWKKTNIPGSKQPGRSVYLRYYAPSAGGGDHKNSRNKTRQEDSPVFEQGENVENPLRCPVKLYEFFLSKCPESIKNRNDVFYLIPELSCVPDSPVWYSTGSLGIESMTKMLNRVRVVKEIQETQLHYQPHYMM